ncbi:TetR/AcrR family transcriptional regulator [Halioxenophilus sp. WMMB6]|uniref:TetR/AcrR family transcriptional regulator n=1 Tax=Halioxenophilus sp. WMMB6 TaxID=3073815 RepID=UPI00295F29C4|nr:TetR/AcrR family transcriptional regulator [Halioxenophilus sp. WMMB6]
MNSSPAKRSRGRPKPEQTANIEKELLDIAQAEFLEYGYGGASLSRMVRVAGISKTTLYSRYASKEELLYAIIDRQIEMLSPAQLIMNKFGPLGLEEGLRSYANYMLSVSLQREMLGINRLVLSESYRFPELGEIAAKRTRAGIKRVADFIRSCAESEQRLVADPQAIAQVFIFAHRGWYIDQLTSHRKVTTRQRQAWVDNSVRIIMAVLASS